MKLALLRLLYIFFCIGVSVYSGVQAPVYFSNSTLIPGFLGTVVAVFAGLSISLLFYVGDASSLAATGNWRILEKYKTTFEAKIIRTLLVVFIQSSAIISICIYFFLKELICSDSYKMAEHAYFSLSCLAILLTIPLPFSLYKSHMERYQLLISYLKNGNVG